MFPCSSPLLRRFILLSKFLCLLRIHSFSSLEQLKHLTLCTQPGDNFPNIDVSLLSLQGVPFWHMAFQSKNWEVLPVLNHTLHTGSSECIVDNGTVRDQASKMLSSLLCVLPVVSGEIPWSKNKVLPVYWIPNAKNTGTQVSHFQLYYI